MLVSYRNLIRDDVRSAIFTVSALKGDKAIYTGIKAYQLMMFRKKYLEHYDCCQEAVQANHQAFSVIIQVNGNENSVVPPSRGVEFKEKFQEILAVQVELPDFEITWSDCDRMGLTVEERGGLHEIGVLKTFPAE